MTLKIKPGVDLAKSFDKLKREISTATRERDLMDKYSGLWDAIQTHLNECTEEAKATENDIPNGLFETFGEIFNPNQPPKLD